MDRVLVFGGTGFLGRHIVGALAESGHQVIVAGREARDPHVRVVDLTDAAATRALMAEVRPGVVVNAAGATSGSEDELRGANVLSVESLAAAVSAAGRPRIVHLGSSAEYGLVPEGGSVRETADARPVGPYGRTKLAATLAILAADPDAIVLRVFNPVGPGAPEQSLLGRAIRALRDALLEDAPEIELGPLDAHRDFVHVADVANAVAAAVRTPSASGIVNVGSGEATLARDLIAELVNVAGYGGTVSEVPHPPGHRSAEVPWQQADLSEARRTLGWGPRRGWRDAVREAWEAGRR